MTLGTQGYPEGGAPEHNDGDDLGDLGYGHNDNDDDNDSILV